MQHKKVLAGVLIGLLVIAGIGLYIYFSCPSCQSGLNLQLYVDTAEGTRVLLSPWSVEGIEATSIGVDFSFSTEGAPDEVQLVFIVEKAVFSGTPDQPVVSWSEIATTRRTFTITDITQNTGSVAWNLDTYFSSYTDGDVHSFKITGTATAYYQGNALGELNAQSGIFSLQWDPGGLTDFTITPGW